MARIKTNDSKKSVKENLPFKNITLILPIIVGIGMMLVVYGYHYAASNLFKDFNVKNTLSIDVFLHSKLMVIYVTAALALLFLLCFLLLGRKLHAEKIMLWGLGFLGLGLMSALLAKDRGVAFFGGKDLFNGWFALASYLVLAYYAYTIMRGDVSRREKLCRYIFRTVMVVALILTVIGVLQFLGWDIFEIDMIKSLLNMKGTTVDSNTNVYLTLYNSNYVGTAVVMMVPLLVAGGMSAAKPLKYFYYVAAIGMAFCLIVSKSKAGIVTLVAMGLGYGIYIGLKMQYRLIISVLAVIVIVATAALLYPINAKHAGGMDRMVTSKKGVELTIDSHNVDISWNDKDIFIKSDGKKINHQFSNTKEIKELDKIVSKAMKNYYGNSNYHPEKVMIENTRIYFFKSGVRNSNARGYVFVIDSDAYFIAKDYLFSGYKYMNVAGNMVDAIDSRDAFSDSMYHMMSNRMYIWSKTLPLLPKHILVGDGMDHFAVNFPNNDYASKAQIKQLGTCYNKPHSSYLQMIMDAGFLAAICMCVFVILIIKKRSDSLSEDENKMADGLRWAMVGFLIISLVNDALVVTAPLFWIIAGLYAGLCYHKTRGLENK